MIYTLTFNPALDYVMRAENIVTGATNRSKAEKIFFGGKGINVSVVLNELGLDTTALGFVAGFTGDELERALKETGVQTDFIHLNSGITRINVKIKGESVTEINANGPLIESGDIDNLFERLESIEAGDTLVLAGSIPSCLPENIYEEIMKHLSERKIRFVVDAGGDLLIRTLQYNPFLIKPNLDELSFIVGKRLSSDPEIVAAAKDLQAKGARNVLVSLGGDGAILLDENACVYRKKAHKISALNTVGAGDSMVAGFLSGIEKGYEYALLLGLAAGAATAEKDGLASKEDIMKFM